MSGIEYRLAERFSAALDGETWEKYVGAQHSTGLPRNLREVVGLDGLLNPHVFQPPSDQGAGPFVDWVRLGLVDSLEYLAEHSGEAFNDPRNQVLAVLREPTQEQVRDAVIPGFVLKGFDLLDEQTGISALTNCGGWPDVYPPSELSECGLIPSHARAYQVREALSLAHPEDAHAQCGVWAIWRLEAA